VKISWISTFRRTHLHRKDTSTWLNKSFLFAHTLSYPSLVQTHNNGNTEQHTCQRFDFWYVSLCSIIYQSYTANQTGYTQIAAKHHGIKVDLSQSIAFLPRDATQSAVLLQQFVSPSVTLRYCDHMG